MNRLASAILALFLCGTVSANDKHPRPRLLGIFSVHFYSANLPAAREFYAQILDDPGIACHWCEATPWDTLIILMPSKQFLIFSAPTGAPPPNMLAEIVFATDDAKAMREYLVDKKVAIEKRKDPDRPGWMESGNLGSFTALDAEGHRIGFIQMPRTFLPSPHTNALRIIHAGFVVNDRAAEDHFYKDVLGFHVYWHGGRDEGKDDWVAMQVPDGTDWVEYVLNISPTANHHTFGGSESHRVGGRRHPHHAEAGDREWVSANRRTTDRAGRQVAA